MSGRKTQKSEDVPKITIDDLLPIIDSLRWDPGPPPPSGQNNDALEKEGIMIAVIVITTAALTAVVYAKHVKSRKN